MKTEQLITDLPKCFRTQTPVLLTGSPGVGKTDIIKEVCSNHHYECLITHPVIADPTDFKGLPAVYSNGNGKNKSQVAEFLPYGNLRQMIEADKPTVVFFDDLGQSSALVQASVMQLILERAIDGKPVSDHVSFIAATNRRKDRAGVKQLLTPLISRMVVIKHEPDVKSWVEWAYHNDLPAEIIAFIEFRPDLLNSFDPSARDSEGDTLVNQPSPRTVARAASLFKMDLKSFEWIEGAVGTSFATEFLGFVSRIEKLGDLPARIVRGDMPDAPTDASELYAITACLVKLSQVTCNRDACVEWAYRKLPAEFCASYWSSVDKDLGERMHVTSHWSDLVLKVDSLMNS